MTGFLAGFGLGGSLILAIGAQNALVLTLGLKRHYQLMAASICALGDMVLILAGVGGLGTVIAANPLLTQIATCGGIAFLVAYAVLALRRALSPGKLDANAAVMPTRSGIALQVLAVTFLNPHVYLDTVVLLGSISASYQADQRIAFALGAMSASVLWFFTIAIGASLLADRLRHTMTWRAIDLMTAAVMLLVAAKLAEMALAVP